MYKVAMPSAKEQAEKLYGNVLTAMNWKGKDEAIGEIESALLTTRREALLEAAGIECHGCRHKKGLISGGYGYYHSDGYGECKAHAIRALAAEDERTTR